MDILKNGWVSKKVIKQSDSTEESEEEKQKTEWR